MNAEQLSAFLKAAKEVPLLQAGGLYATGAIISPYPVKEHHDLVTTKRMAPSPQNKMSRFLLADAEKRSGPRNVRAYELPYFSLFQRLFHVIYIFIKYG
jgi:hypothetical protein